jgi:hypothetical protein
VRRRRSGQKGTRLLDGRYYMLAGRGTREWMAEESKEARKHWRLVRIVPMGPLARVLDDYGLYVFEAREGGREE